MKKKILRLMMFTVILALLAVGIATMMQLFRMRKILRDNAEYSGSQVEEYSEEAMRKQISSRLYATAVGCAYTTNMKMMDLAATVRMIADSATDIYNNPDKYGRSEVEQITPEMVGKEGAQFLWAEDVNLEDPKIKEEFSMIANFKGNLAAMYTKFPELAADYIGTESGLMLLSGPILSERWDENGNYGYLDPRERPWYKGALEEKGVYFSSVTKDYDTGLATIMCSYPVYKGDDIVAVTGAGIYLEDMDKFMLNAKIEEGGSACVVDKEGNVIFSTRNSGALEVGKNLLSSGNKNRELLDLTKRGLYGKSAVEILEIDGENCCAAYSPVESVGWIFVSIVPEKLVTEPTTKLLASLKENREAETKSVDEIIKTELIAIFLIFVFVASMSIVMANHLANKLVKPIEKLTDNVQKLKGDQLKFNWTINTNDEIQTLANSFCSMAKRMGQYIQDIQNLTAEKERVNAELDLARQIQADMLPNIFPAFPDRKDFDIFAKMTPAKEVGGDLYDFYMIDGDHLAISIADVSGKGVPAALFMVTAKIHLKNRSLYGGNPKPSEVLEDVNNLLCEGNDMDFFVTAWLGIITLSTGHVIAANAGHEYPVVMDGNGNFELMMDKHGFVLAGCEGTKYLDYEFDLDKNGGLFIYTDGVAEATNTDQILYGTGRMVEALNSAKETKPEKVIERVEADINEFCGDAPQFDDTTMVSFRWNG